MTQPNTYAKNNLAAYIPPDCPRCGKPASFTWATVLYQLPPPVPMMYPDRHWCDTPGCVDENGYNSVLPYRPLRPTPILQSGYGATVEFYPNEWKCRTCGATGPEPGGSEHLDTHKRRRLRWWRR